jgi:hypothetical protein
LRFLSNLFTELYNCSYCNSVTFIKRLDLNYRNKYSFQILSRWVTVPWVDSPVLPDCCWPSGASTFVFVLNEECFREKANFCSRNYSFIHLLIYLMDNYLACTVNKTDWGNGSKDSPSTWRKRYNSLPQEQKSHLPPSSWGWWIPRSPLLIGDGGHGFLLLTFPSSDAFLYWSLGSFSILTLWLLFWLVS